MTSQTVAQCDGKKDKFGLCSAFIMLILSVRQIYEIIIT